MNEINIINCNIIQQIINTHHFKYYPSSSTKNKKNISPLLKMSDQNILDKLDHDTFGIILSKLSGRDLNTMRKTNKRIGELIQENDLMTLKLNETRDMIDLKNWTQISKNYKQKYLEIKYENGMLTFKTRYGEVRVENFYLYKNGNIFLVICINKIYIFDLRYYVQDPHVYDIEKYMNKEIVKIILGINKIFIIYKNNEILVYPRHKDMIIKEYKIIYMNDIFIFYKDKIFDKFYVVIYNKFDIFTILVNTDIELNFTAEFFVIEDSQIYLQNLDNLRKYMNSIKKIDDYDYSIINDYIENLNSEIEKYYEKNM